MVTITDTHTFGDPVTTVLAMDQDKVNSLRLLIYFYLFTRSFNIASNNFQKNRSD